MLSYPFEEIPKPGEVKEVLPGVIWVRFQMPFELDHINLWLLKDGDGWTLVDTGILLADGISQWEALLSGPLKDVSISRVICTHLHPDHVGMAGWFVKKFGADFLMTRTDYLLARALVSDTGEDVPDEALEFYRAAGSSEEAIEVYQKRFGFFGKLIYKLPKSYTRIKDGDRLQIGEHVWQVVVGRGHTAEHACLYCPDLKLLISGDQVLPRISSNISVFPTEPLQDPLTDWLESCAHFKNLLPDETLVLPAHNEPFYGLHERLQGLIDEHENALSRLYEDLSEPKRAVDVFSILFKRTVGSDNYLMATGEALAHLRCLETRGQVVREKDDNKVDWYRQAD